MTALPSPWDDARLTVVMPTYNEVQNLPMTTASVLGLPLPGLRLLIVDDNSPDGTGELADRMAQDDPRVRVMHRTAKDGLGRAYAAGIGAALDAGAEFVLQMDADGSHPAAYIPHMLGTALATDAGLVIGSRYVPGGRLAAQWPWHRRALSTGANVYVSAILGLRIRDVTAGFNLWSAAALRDVGLAGVRSNGYSFQVETKFHAVRTGHRVVEVPIRFEERAHGVSKMSFAVQRESALLPLRLRWRHRGSERGAAPVSGTSREAAERPVEADRRR